MIFDIAPANFTVMLVYCHKIGDYAVLLWDYRHIALIMTFLRQHCENYAVTCRKSASGYLNILGLSERSDYLGKLISA
jgi:hypothetical protein